MAELVEGGSSCSSLQVAPAGLGSPCSFFLQCDPLVTPGGSGVLADPGRIDEEFRKAWLPWFCRSGQRETSLEEFTHEVEGWLPFLPEVALPRLGYRLLIRVGGLRLLRFRGFGMSMMIGYSLSRDDALNLDGSLANHDVSTAPLLDLRRRLKLVVDLLSAMIRGGVSLARSVELAVQWDAILRAGPIHPITAEDCLLARGGDLGQCCQVVQGLHRRLSDFIHAVVVHRREEAIRGWRGWSREDSFVHPFEWLRPELVPPAPILQCDPALTPGGSGVLADPLRIDEEFQKAWFPCFCRSGRRETNLEEFAHEVGGWLPVLPEVVLPRLSGSLLAEVVHRKGATAGSLDVWGWREFKVLPVSWFDGLARILSEVEETGFWLEGLLDAYIALIPKSDGDATHPWGSVLSVFSLWCIAFGPLLGWGSWKSGFSLGSLTRFSVLGVVAVLLRLGTLLLLTLKRSSLVQLTLTFIFSLLMS